LSRRCVPPASLQPFSASTGTEQAPPYPLGTPRSSAVNATACWKVNFLYFSAPSSASNHTAVESAARKRSWCAKTLRCHQDTCLGFCRFSQITDLLLLAWQWTTPRPRPLRARLLLVQETRSHHRLPKWLRVAGRWTLKQTSSPRRLLIHFWHAGTYVDSAFGIRN